MECWCSPSVPTARPSTTTNGVYEGSLDYTDHRISGAGIYTGTFDGSFAACCYALELKEGRKNESFNHLLIQEEAIEHVRKVAERERAPMYVVGETTGDHRFSFQQADIPQNSQAGFFWISPL